METMSAWIEPYRRFRTISGDRWITDLIVLLATTTVAFLIAGHFDLFERYVDWAHTYEAYELDEILVLTFFSTIAAFVFATRRSLDSNTLLAELQAYRNDLEQLVDRRTEELTEKSERLEKALEAEKVLNAVQRSFVSMASHEFRTPLAIIDGAAQRIQRRLAKKDIETAEVQTAKIRRTVLRMTRLIETTLSAAQIDAGTLSVNPVDCDLAAILSECCESLQQLTEQHDVQLSTDNLPPTICADKHALEQIFTNLLSNAVKYSPDGCDIFVRARREGDDVLVSIEDRGLGMDEEDQSKLFQRFFRAKTSVGIAGTGIGLSLIRTLIERHGGEISVTSTLGEGTTFTVRLPVDASAPQPVASVGAEGGPGLAEKETDATAA